MEQGVLQLTLSWDGEQIVAAGVVSTRPTLLRLLCGLPAARVSEFIPRLFSLCRCAQETAARLSLQAARGEGEGEVIDAAGRPGLAVAVEAFGEHLWRLLLDWPPLCGEAARQSESIPALLAKQGSSMHEMSLAMGILQIVEDAARAQRFQRVRSVEVEIGELAAVEAEAIRFCFAAVTRGTLAEGAKLHVTSVLGEGLCFNCNQTVPLAALYDPCPICGGYPVQATGGTEMRVKELEVE